MTLNHYKKVDIVIIALILFVPALANLQSINNIEHSNFEVKINEKNLIDGLSSNIKKERDSCAYEIRKILLSGKNIVAPGNIVEYSTDYWTKKVEEFQIKMLRSKLYELFELKNKPVGVLNSSVNYQLDNTHSLTVVNEMNSDKIRLIRLSSQIKANHVEVDAGYSGLWRNYYSNGEIWIEHSFKNGKRNGMNRHFNSEGKLVSTGYYINNVLKEQNRFDIEGYLKAKTIFNNENKRRETLKYNKSGFIISQKIYLNNRDYK